MNRKRLLGTATAAIVAGVGLSPLVLAPTASAGGEACRRVVERERMGPPLVCHPIQIGDAKSLPFGSDAFDVQRGYDVKQVVGDTLDILKSEKSILVRMETLRRATVYVRGHRDLATELLAKLAWKALDAEADGDQKTDDGRAVAWFDAGCFAASLSQFGIDIGGKPGYADGVVGYAWIEKALQLSSGNPEMEFAAALATHPGMRDSKRDLFEAHLRKAAAGVNADPLLAANLRAHLAIWGESLDQIAARGK